VAAAAVAWSSPVLLLKATADEADFKIIPYPLQGYII